MSLTKRLIPPKIIGFDIGKNIKIGKGGLYYFREPMWEGHVPFLNLRYIESNLFSEQ